MIVSGMFTCSMFIALLSPTAGLELIFGEQVLEEPFTEIVVRNWGALIGMVGVLLIYGGLKPHSRNLILVIAVVSKAVFISLNLAIGIEYLSSTSTAIILDSIFILLYITYLLTHQPAENV